MKTEVITIVGLNREGTSIGLALKKAFPNLTFVGHDADRELGNEAKSLGAMDKTNWSLISACSQADILILNLPIDSLKESLQRIGGDLQPHALVLDMGLLKSDGLKWAEQFVTQGHYVGVRPILARPFMSDGRSSLESASADMYRDSVFCLMPSAKADPQAVETAVNVGVALGGSPYFLDAAEYDNLAQSVELMPRLMAVAMFSAINKSKGWRDILRFAGLPFSLATHALEKDQEIAHLTRNDKEATMRWLGSLITELQEMQRWLYHEDSESVSAVLESISIERERWLLDREKNQWVESKTPRVEMPTVSQTLFGGLANRGQQEKDE